MFLVFVVVLPVVLIFYIKWCQQYWQRKHVPTLKPEFFFGNARKVVTSQVSVAEDLSERYFLMKKMNSKYVGSYVFWKPVLTIIDVDFIKNVLIKDFSNFLDRGNYNHKKDILSMHLFNLEGQRWKDLRPKISPVFTSGKIKIMFSTILEKATGLTKIVEQKAGNREAFDMKDIFSRFTIDIIGSCAFGIECNCLMTSDNDFKTYGQKALGSGRLKNWIWQVIPWTVLGNIGIKKHGRDVTNFFSNIVKQTIKIRKENNIIRNDFIHLLLEFNEKCKNSHIQDPLTENEIIAQCFVFFLGGFETSSTVVTFAILELAQNQTIQTKLRENINNVLKKHNGQITYDSVKEMEYLDWVINESLRMYPPLSFLQRICTKDYVIPGTNIVLKKGTNIEIPIRGIQRDPAYYPNPEVFDPERFRPEVAATRPDLTFLSFGEGPRICIGMRFGLLQSKVGLATLIRDFKFTLSNKTSIPIKIQRGSFVTSVEGNVWVEAERISSS